MDGKPWKESRGEIEIFVSGVNGLIFEVRNRSGIKKASICMSLDGMKKDPNLVYKLRIQGEYIKADQCKIKITDLGVWTDSPGKLSDVAAGHTAGKR